MSKFKLNSEYVDSEKNLGGKKKHSTKKHRDHEDFTDFAYMSRGTAKEELRYLRETYGI